MEKIQPKPLRLLGKVQNYSWGTKNKDAYIPKFLGINPEPDLPYAEYWIGVHPKAPSDLVVNGKTISLPKIIENYPSEILGDFVAEKFNGKLPFLLKVLSINQALSIQAHPDKNLAKLLQKKDPKNYPDDNHKPEIAIAIDNLEAIVGLRKLEEIKTVLQQNPELNLLLSKELISELNTVNNNSEGHLVKEIYSQIMRVEENKLEECINDLKDKFEKKTVLTESEKQFLIQYNFYGIDIGLISLLLFNLVELNKSDAIFTPAGIPHAYLKGNIVECMANSDNVVRAGLTPKYKDVETLIKMLEIDSSNSVVQKVESNDYTIYKTPAEEFEIKKLKRSLVVKNNNEISIILIVEGKVSVSTEEGDEIYVRGNVVLIPAILKNYSITKIESSEVYMVSVPNL